MWYVYIYISIHTDKREEKGKRRQEKEDKGIPKKNHHNWMYISWYAIIYSVNHNMLSIDGVYDGSMNVWYMFAIVFNSLKLFYAKELSS